MADMKCGTVVWTLRVSWQIPANGILWTWWRASAYFANGREIYWLAKQLLDFSRSMLHGRNFLPAPLTPSFLCANTYLQANLLLSLCTLTDIHFALVLQFLL